MEIETTTVARQYRLMEWADQIRDCHSRPNGMSVDEWCHTHDISKANYYYRLSQVRKACLDQIREFGDNGWYQLKDEIYNRYRFTPAKIE